MRFLTIMYSHNGMDNMEVEVFDLEDPQWVPGATLFSDSDMYEADFEVTLHPTLEAAEEFRRVQLDDLDDYEDDDEYDPAVQDNPYDPTHDPDYKGPDTMGSNL